MSGESPLVESLLRQLGRDLGPTCGIHGDRIVDRRCPSCDADRSTPARAVDAWAGGRLDGTVTPSTYDHPNADQATNP